MCEFKSAIITRTGKLYHSPWTDSHEELITIFDLRDNRVGNLCRVEFKPADKAYLDKLDKYKLRIDEERTPDWFTESKQEKVTAELRGIVSRMIIDKPVKLLFGGSYIITKGATIEEVNYVRILCLCGGTINAVYGGTIEDVRGGTINAVCGGTIEDVRGGTIEDVRGGTIKVVS